MLAQMENLFYSSVIGAAHRSVQGKAASPSDGGAKSLLPCESPAVLMVVLPDCKAGKERKMNRMLCGYLDDTRQWEEAEEEDTDPRTLMERRLGWLESEWQEAVKADDYESWHDVRMMIYGASQS